MAVAEKPKKINGLGQGRPTEGRAVAPVRLSVDGRADNSEWDSGRSFASPNELAKPTHSGLSYEKLGKVTST